MTFAKNVAEARELCGCDRCFPGSARGALEVECVVHNVKAGHRCEEDAVACVSRQIAARRPASCVVNTIVYGMLFSGHKIGSSL